MTFSPLKWSSRSLAVGASWGHRWQQMFGMAMLAESSGNQFIPVTFRAAEVDPHLLLKYQPWRLQTVNIISAIEQPCGCFDLSYRREENAGFLLWSVITLWSCWYSRLFHITAFFFFLWLQHIPAHPRLCCDIVVTQTRWTNTFWRHVFLSSAGVQTDPQREI